MQYSLIGRIIMFQVCFDLIIFTYKIAFGGYKAYKQYKEHLSEYEIQKNIIIEKGDQSDNDSDSEEGDNDQDGL